MPQPHLNTAGRAGTLAALLAASGLAAAAYATETAPTMTVKSGRVVSKNALSEAQYQELLRCTLVRNRPAVEAFVDTRFEMGRGHAAVFERETGARVGLQMFSGCFEFKSSTGTFPFSFDRLAGDWAASLGITKADPNTMDKRMGRTPVGNFASYVACIRRNNSHADVQSFVSAPLDSVDAVVQSVKLGEKCPAADGVSFRANLATLADALRADGAQN